MRFIHSHGARIGFLDVGVSDTALLCLPDLCNPHQTMQPLVDALAPRHRVITIDYRARGMSPHPHVEFGLFDLVEDVLAVIDVVRPSRIVPIAQGQAGWIAIELRRRLDGRVPKFVSLEWALDAPSRHFVALLENLQGRGSWEKARDRLFEEWSEGAPASAVEAIRKSMYAIGEASYARVAREISNAYEREGSPMRALSWLSPRMPVLHVFSSGAPATRSPRVAVPASDEPWLETVGLDASSHYPALEAPRAVAALIERFLERSRPDKLMSARESLSHR